MKSTLLSASSSRTLVATPKRCGAVAHTTVSASRYVGTVCCVPSHRHLALSGPAPQPANAARPSPCIVTTEPPYVGPAPTGERCVSVVGCVK